MAVKADNIFLLLCNCNYNTRKKITMQFTFLQLLKHFANVLLYQMLKLILVIVDFNDKRFITNRIINNSETSLTEWTDKRNNFSHELRQASRFSNIFQIKDKKKNYLPYTIFRSKLKVLLFTK